LQRARAQMTEHVPDEAELVEPEQSDQRAVLDSYVAAFERSDMSALTRLLHRDAVLEMPPFLSWFAGREAVQRFFGGIWARRAPGSWHMTPTGANRQPAAGAYVRADDSILRAHSVQVFTIGHSGIMRIVALIEPALFEPFGLPAVWSPD